MRYCSCTATGKSHRDTNSVMATWDSVSTEWNPEEETVNFGTRQCVVIGNSLYDVVTVVTIECSGEPEKDPQITGIASGNYLALAVDGNLHILKDNLVFGSLSFSSPITQICWDGSSQFLFVISEDGCLNTLFVPQMKLLPSRNLPNFEGSVPVGLLVTEGNPSEVLILNNKGFLIRLQNVDLSGLAKAIADKTWTEAMGIQNGISIEQLDLPLKSKSEVICATLSLDFRGDVHVIASLANNSVIDWDILRNCCSKTWPSPSRINQVQVTKCKRFIVCLSEDGGLFYLCGHTFIQKTEFQVKGQQFILAEFEKSLRGNQVFVYGNGKLVMKEFLGRKSDYELNVGDFIRLITPQPLRCNLMFLEGSRNNGNHITNLRLRSLTEGQPSLKLQRLIQRGNFAEAEEFAKLFNLDSQPIFTAKAAHLMDKFSVLASKTDAEDAAGAWSEWIQTLHLIQDLDFVMQSCLKAAPPTLPLIRNTLNFADERLRKTSVTDRNEEEIQMYQERIVEARENLLLLELVYPNDVVNLWYSSIYKDYLSWFIHLLCKGDMKSALTLWNRHGKGIANDLAFTGEDLSSLLTSIPLEEDYKKLLPFLRQILLDVVKFCVDYLPIVTDWIIAKARLLEGRNGESGTQDALEFSETLYNFLLSTATASNSGQIKSYLQPLTCFIEDLKDLKCLRKDYKIPILLVHFTEKDKLQVVSQLLNYLQDAKQVRNIFDNFLLDFMQRRIIDSDTVVLHQIEVLLGRFFKWWRSCTFQEEIVLTLVSYVRDTEMKCRAILKTLSQAAVPWSDVMQQLADVGCMMDHPLSGEIQSQRSLVPLKSVFRLYDIREFETNSYNFMDSVIGYILKQQKETCLEDALLVASSCSQINRETVYSRCLFHLLGIGKVDIMLSQLRGFTPARRVNFVQLYISRLEQTLRDFSKRQTPSTAILVERFTNSLHLVLECCNNSCDPGTWNKLVEDAELLTRIHTLGVKYRVLISPGDYCSPGERLAALRQFCSSNLESLNVVHLKQVAFLLEISTAKALEVVIELAASKGLKDLAVSCSKQLVSCEDTPEAAESYYKAAHVLTATTSAAEEVELKSGLANKAATYCSSDQLLDATELSHWTRIVQNVFSKFAVVSNTNQDQDGHYWNPTWLCGVHQDFTVPILNQNILDRIAQVLLTVLPEAKIHHTAYQSSLKVFSSESVTEKLNLMQNLAKICESVIRGLRSSQQLICAVKCALSLEEILLPLVAEVPDDWQNLSVKTCAETREQLASQLLMRILSAKRPDCLAALTCLLILGPENGLHSLETLSKKFAKDRRLYPVAYLGYYFSVCCSHSEGMNTFQDLLRTCHWNRRLAKFNVTLHEPDAAQAALNTLVSNVDLEMKLLSEFCTAFDLKIDPARKLHIQFLLSKIGPSEPVSIKESICDKVKEVMELLQTPSEAYDIIRESCAQISPYNYEFWLFAYDLLNSIDMTIDSTKNAPELPIFLLSYKRRVPPRHNEKSAPFFRLPGSELANERLPYFYRLNPSLAKAIYQEEFDLENWQRWLRLAPFIDFSRDEVCITAVYNSVRSNSSRPDPEIFFTQVRKCLEHVEDWLMATACTEDLLREMTSPTEKLCAAKLQMDLSTKIPNEAEGRKLYQRGIAICQKLETEKLLREFRIVEEKYLKLSSQGKQLIRVLYEDLPADYQTLNRAVDQICDVYDVSSKTIRMSLVEEWLSPVDEFVESLDDSFRDQNDAQNQQNLERIVCILHSSDLDTLAAMMLDKANTTDNISASTYRHRALTCLQMVLKDKEIRSILGMDPAALDMQVKASNFIHRLEQLGLPFKPEEFEEADKGALIQILLQNGALTSACVVLAVDLAVAFGVTKISLWNAILNGLVKFNLIEKAAWLVREICGIPLLWKNPVLAPAWNMVLQDPFRKNEGTDERMCLEALDLLWKCPVFHYVDVPTLEGLILTSEYPSLAVLLLPFYVREERDGFLKRIKPYGNPEDLLNKIEQKYSEFQHFVQLRAHLP